MIILKQFAELVLKYETLMASVIPTLIVLVIGFLINRKLENIKYDLQKNLVGYQAKYSYFYKKQMLVVETLHEKLTKACMSLNDHVLAIDMGLKDTSFFSEQTEKILQDALHYSEINKLYFDDNSYASISDLIKIAKNANIDLKHGYIPPLPGAEAEDSESVIRARKEIQEKLPVIRNDLRNKFRNTLWPEPSEAYEAKKIGCQS